VLFALVANRALVPCSKLAAAEWASEHVVIPRLAVMDGDHAQRNMSRSGGKARLPLMALMPAGCGSSRWSVQPR
jgi:hypothetical protein